MQLSLPVCLLHVCAVGVLTSGTGSELEEARKRFQEEMSSVQDLRSTITGALERLRLESDTLQREDASLRAREERMVASFERLKEKEAYYKERGKKKFQTFLYI
jgi:chromosome segregation ATPase